MFGTGIGIIEGSDDGIVVSNNDGLIETSRDGSVDNIDEAKGKTSLDSFDKLEVL